MGRWTIKDHVLGAEKPKPLPYKCFMCLDEGWYWADPRDLESKVCKCQAEVLTRRWRGMNGK